MLQFIPHLEIAFRGPDLNKGPLPAAFYFSLSAEDSLNLDPFNQPVEFLSSYPMRIFSLTLPGHENKLDPTKAMSVWAEEFFKGTNVVDAFIHKVSHAVHELLKMGVLIPGKIAVFGLSRGGFIATHAAAKISQFKYVLGFAPLTELGYLKEFHHLKDDTLTLSTNLVNLAPNLLNCSVRFYIGNRDTRVGTAECFHFIQHLTETAYHHKIRSPQVELFITPSIGHQGHGTSKETFQDGAAWLAKALL